MNGYGLGHGYSSRLAGRQQTWLPQDDDDGTSHIPTLWGHWRGHPTSDNDFCFLLGTNGTLQTNLCLIVIKLGNSLNCMVTNWGHFCMQTRLAELFASEKNKTSHGWSRFGNVIAGM